MRDHKLLSDLFESYFLIKLSQSWLKRLNTNFKKILSVVEKKPFSTFCFLAFFTQHVKQNWFICSIMSLYFLRYLNNSGFLFLFSLLFRCERFFFFFFLAFKRCFMLTVGHNKLFCAHAICRNSMKSSPACFCLVSVFPHIPDSYYVKRNFFATQCLFLCFEFSRGTTIAAEFCQVVVDLEQ